MNALLMAGLCAGAALGLLMIGFGLTGRQVLPASRSLFPSGTSAATATAWTAGAVVVSLAVLALTRWVGAAIGIGILLLAMPWFFGGSGTSKRDLERTQAIATWAEMIRDNLSGAAGLEQALGATAEIAPRPIDREVRAFANRLDSMSVVDALVLLGEDLDNPAADLVVVSLANASRMEGRDLGPLLTRLAESIRADIRMRLRVAVGRARIQTSAKIVMFVTLATVAIIYIFSRDLLDVYDSTVGQFWLLAVFGLFLVSMWFMNHYAVLQVPERFTARRAGMFGRSPATGGEGP
jgi:Flp pilus assembly protein TadB